MSQNRVKNRVKCTKHPNWPSWAHLGAHSGRIVALGPGRVAACMAVLPPARPCSLAPAPHHLPARPARLAARISAPCRRSSCCIAIQPCPIPLLPCHNTPECIAIHSAPVIKPLLQYSELYYDTVLAPIKLRLAQLYRNTIASQPSLLQYNLSHSNSSSSHDTMFVS